MKKGQNETYSDLVDKLLKHFGSRLQMIVLFGSRARGDSRPHSDHDIFLVIENLPRNVLMRLKEVRTALWDIPLRINTIAKTLEEVERNLTPLMLEVFVDGKCLYDNDLFQSYRKKAVEALNESGLKRKRIGGEWYWQFETIPHKEWELTWEGFNELS